MKAQSRCDIAFPGILVFLILQTKIMSSAFCGLKNQPRGQFYHWEWSGGAMLLGKLPVPGRPTILIQ